MAKNLPSKGPNSPFSIGKRTLIARTCKGCGNFYDADSFPVIIGVGARRQSCHDCVNLYKKRAREERGIGLPPARRPPEHLQVHKYRRWTKGEDDLLRECVGEVPYEELALALGRSVLSVYARRDALGIPVVRKRNRVATPPWNIQIG